MKSTYTPNLTTDQYYSTVAAHVLGTPQVLDNKTSTGGTADADDVTFLAVTTGFTVSYLLIYEDTGTAGTSPLIALFDTATGLPATTTGGDVAVSFNASGIFTL